MARRRRRPQSDSSSTAYTQLPLEIQLEEANGINLVPVSVTWTRRVNDKVKEVRADAHLEQCDDYNASTSSPRSYICHPVAIVALAGLMHEIRYMSREQSSRRSFSRTAQEVRWRKFCRPQGMGRS